MYMYAFVYHGESTTPQMHTLRIGEICMLNIGKHRTLATSSFMESLKAW